jgi:hypothetical protein
MVQRAAILLLEYVDAMGGHDHCEREVLEVSFHAISKLLGLEPDEYEEAQTLVGELEAVVRQKIARRRAA